MRNVEAAGKRSPWALLPVVAVYSGGGPVPYYPNHMYMTPQRSFAITPQPKAQQRNFAILSRPTMHSAAIPADDYSNIDQLINSARVGAAGISEVDAKRILSRAPWYARALRLDLNAQGFLRRVALWNDPKLIESLTSQQHALILTKQILHCAIAALDQDDLASVCSNTVEDFKKYFWTQVRGKIGRAISSRAPLKRLAIPADVCDELHNRDVSRATREDVDDSIDYEVLRDAETVMDILASNLPDFSIEEERLQKSLTDFTKQLKDNGKCFNEAYGTAAMRTLTNPMVLSDNGRFAPNTFGLQKPAHMLLGGLSTGFGGVDKDLPSPNAAKVGNPTGVLITDAVETDSFVAPFASILPPVNQGWSDQIQMMEYLGRPGDEGTATAQLASLKETLQSIENLSHETLEAISLAHSILNAVTEVLRSPSWNNQRADLRWYKVCVINKLNEVMRASKVGKVMTRIMSGCGTRPPARDYEYLRLLAEAKKRDPHGAAGSVYQWLTNSDQTPDTLYPVVVQGSFAYDSNVSISRRRLELAGLADKIVRGDVDYVVKPIYITAETLDLIEELTRHGEKIGVAESSRPQVDDKIQIRKIQDVKPDPFGSAEMADADRFEIIKAEKKTPYPKNMMGLKSALKSPIRESQKAQPRKVVFE